MADVCSAGPTNDRAEMIAGDRQAVLDGAARHWCSLLVEQADAHPAAGPDLDIQLQYRPGESQRWCDKIPAFRAGIYGDKPVTATTRRL